MVSAFAKTLWLAAGFALPAALQDQDDVRREAPSTWSQPELARVAREIQGQIAAVRGAAFARDVAVEISDERGLVEHAQKRMDSLLPRAKQAADEEIAKLLGWIPAGLDARQTMLGVLARRDAGFYDPGLKRLYVMSSYAGDRAKPVLAHELTHALDDQLYDLDGRLPSLIDNLDGYQAYVALMEGSAAQAASGWLKRHGRGLDPRALTDTQNRQLGGLQDVPAYFWKPLLASYTQGVPFLAHGQRAGAEPLERAFRAPPRSMEQILHPEKYWSRPDEPRRIELDLAALPEGWKVLAVDTYGELYLALLTETSEGRGGLNAKNMGSLFKPTHAAAEGWGGDRLVLLGKGEARVLRLVTVWDTPADAREFHAAALKALAGLDDEGWTAKPERSVRAAFQGAMTEAEAGEAWDTVVIDARLGVGAAEAPALGWREVGD